MTDTLINAISLLDVSISDLHDAFSKSNTTSNSTLSRCEPAIDHHMFYQFSLIPAILITLSLAMTKKRRTTLLWVLDGRPSLIHPFDSLTRTARVSYACAFGATVNLVYTVIRNSDYAVDYTGPDYWKIFIIIVSVFIYGMVFFPLFACLAVGSVFGYGLGALYVWMMTAIEIFRLTECDTSAEGRTLVIFRGLPMVLCLLYLSLSIPVRFIQSVGRRPLFVWQSELEDDTFQEVRSSYIGRHVTKLLKKPEIHTEDPGSRFAVVKYINVNTIWSLRYRWREGFRYPTALLSVSLVGAMVVYMFTVEWIGLSLLFERFIRLCKTAGVAVKLVMALEVFTVSLYLSTFLSMAVSFFNILHTLTNFRSNLQAMYKGDRSKFPSDSSNSVHCVGSLKYGGFQVGYIIWGFLVQNALIFIFCFVVGFLVYVTPSLLAPIFRLFSPPLLSMVLILATLRLLAIFVFLQDRAAYLALDNRGLYFIFNYFMFFYNIFIGLSSCLLRIVKSMVIGTCLLSRLDYCLLPRQFEFLDPGFKAYVGYMYMEHAHTHPVVLVFTKLLLLNVNSSKASSTQDDSLVHLFAVCQKTKAMADTFLDVFNGMITDLQNERSSENDTKNATTCESAIDHYKFYQFSLIPAVLITLSFAMTKRRRNMLLSVMDGRPSIVLPLDSFTRVARISYSCAFAATVNLVYDVVLPRKFAIDYSGPNSLRSFINIVSVFIYGMAFFPLFACLAVGSVFGYGLGALYVWIMTAIQIFKLTECDTNTEGRTIVIFRGLPMVLCLLYLSLSIPVRFVQAVKRGRFFVWQSHLEVVTLDEIRRSYIGRHVTKLLRKPETESLEEPGGRFSVVKSINLNTIWRLRYRWREGFRYPTVLLSVSLVGFLTVYISTLELFGLVSVLDKILRHNKEWVESVEYVGTDDVQFELEWWRTIVHLQEILKFSVITGAVVSFAISVVNIVHSLTRFRKNLQALYKGDHSTIPPAYKSSNSIHCAGSLKFGGFQVAYIFAGYITQLVVVFLICFIIGVLAYVQRDIFVTFLEWFWPVALTLIIMLIVQRLLAMFIFLQDRASYLALDNRGFYFVFNYFMFFYNIFIGLASCLLRIVKSVLIGTCLLSRLDYCLLPRNFEFLDQGFKAYVGYMHMEHAHTHPVVLVFTKLLLLRINSTFSSAQDDRFVHLAAFTDVSQNRSQLQRRRAVRFKWHVTYTLLRNPDLLYTRKVFNQTQNSRALATRGTTDGGHIERVTSDDVHVTVA